jgi:hypothetical protein
MKNLNIMRGLVKTLTFNKKAKINKITSLNVAFSALAFCLFLAVAGDASAAVIDEATKTGISDLLSEVVTVIGALTLGVLSVSGSLMAINKIRGMMR